MDMIWKDGKTSPPPESGKYLTYELYRFTKGGSFHLRRFSKDLSKDSIDFENMKGVPGWYESDGEWGDYLIDGKSLKWTDLPKPPNVEGGTNEA